ncbi:GNAT family N-acetyltransferase [Metapseudomonas furukawaii]|uniref:GNAT family N-acetyltransferase n=1 Tax=Metapseudomonas furukawaii TaxID=1149133 RepID=UPI00227B3BFE|nr:GNAT family N-acetyltransferase [Pseudomonas furukawaii]WAG77878.1 GNAT family N-acetyltransferase [Pseudomonas furukawaii]
MHHTHDIIISSVTDTEATLDFVFTFERRQVVDRVLRRRHGRVVEDSDPFVDDWTEAERQQVKDDLLGCLARNGILCLASSNDRVVGFACMDGQPVDDAGRYHPLKEFHVEASARGRGIGKRLFAHCVDAARSRGFKRLYISSHSARETVLFYKSQGCRDAAWLFKEQIEREPFDYQMEYVVGD